MAHCPYCTAGYASGMEMFDHILTHPEAVGVLLCGTCWLPAEQGHRCAAALTRHVLGWRRDRTPNPRDGDGWRERADAWLLHSAALWRDAELAS